MNRFWLCFQLLFFLGQGFTQTVNPVLLADCLDDAKKHAEISGRPALFARQSQLRTAQLESSAKPAFWVNSRASLQTENVDLGIESPFFSSPDLPLAQFRLTLDGTWLIANGGVRKAQIAQEQALFQEQAQSVEVELYGLRERVNRPFFAILLLRQQVRLLESYRTDLLARAAAMEGAVEAGAKTSADLERLRVQILRLDGEIEKAGIDIRGFFAMLSALTGKVYAEDTPLLAPEPPSGDWKESVSRPELQLLTLQQQQIASVQSLTEARRKPQVSAFVQTGVGYPNPLNFFEDQLSPFALGGIQLSWKIPDRAQIRRDQELIDIQNQLIENRKAQFIQTINQLDAKFREDFTALQVIMRQYEAIAVRQEAIRMESAAQVELGTLSVTEYLRDVQAALQTALQLETCRIQLRQLYADFLTLKGKI